MNPVTNPSPKARFLESNENISKHRAMVDTREFERGIDFAVMQYSLLLANNPVPETQLTLGPAGLKLAAVHEFITVLRNLSEVPKQEPTIVAPTLNHRV